MLATVVESPVLHEIDFAPLPPGVASVAECKGDWSIARIKGTNGVDKHLAAHLTDCSVDWYAPRQQTEQKYEYDNGSRLVRRTWTRAFIAGFIFVAGGWRGREIAQEYGARFSGRLYGWVGGTPGTGFSSQLAVDLMRVERMLELDPALVALTGIKRGVKVKVRRGAWQGMEGVVEGDGTTRGTFYVLLHTLGSSVPVEMPLDMLEPVH